MATPATQNSGSEWTEQEIGGIFPKGAPITPVSRNSDHIDLFVVGDDGKVYSSWWATGSDWSGQGDKWGSVGGGSFPPGVKVSAVSRHGDHLDLFVVDSNGDVRSCWWSPDNGWSGLDKDWGNLGNPGKAFSSGAEVAALARYENTLDLFVFGADGNVYSKWWAETADWSDWNNIGPVFPSNSVPADAKVTAVARTPESLDLFVVGNDGRVNHSWWTQDNGWSGLRGWGSIGGAFSSDEKKAALFVPGMEISAVSRSPDNLDVFIAGNDGYVYHSYWYTSGEWSGVNDKWATVPGTEKFSVSTQIATLSRSISNLEVFACSADNKLFHTAWDQQSDWSSSNGKWDLIDTPRQPEARVSAISRKSDNLDVFICDSDGRVHSVWWASSS